MVYVLSRRVRRDILRLAADIAHTDGRGAADTMIDRVTASFEMLGEHPLADGTERAISASGIEASHRG